MGTEQHTEMSTKLQTDEMTERLIDEESAEAPAFPSPVETLTDRQVLDECLTHLRALNSIFTDMAATLAPAMSLFSPMLQSGEGNGNGNRRGRLVGKIMGM